MACSNRYNNSISAVSEGKLWPAPQKPRKRKSQVRHADVPRYVVKLHDDDDTGEDAAVLRFDEFDDAVNCCADLSIPFFVDASNKKLVSWFVRTDDCGHPKIARCTEREFTSLVPAPCTAPTAAPYIP